MKMSAEFAGGKILFNLKHSNLHYVIKETHMSADITIRKKFIKDTEDPAIMEGIQKVVIILLLESMRKSEWRMGY